MICWRCGRRVAISNGREVTSTRPHADWCSMPGGCSHCGWRPHRWWCMNGWNAAELASVAYAGHSSGSR